MLADHNLHKESILMESYNIKVGSAITYIIDSRENYLRAFS